MSREHENRPKGVYLDSDAKLGEGRLKLIRDVFTRNTADARK